MLNFCSHKWHTSVRFRLVVVTIVLVCLIVGLLSFANYLRRITQIQEETQRDHEHLVMLMANTFAPAIFNFNTEAMFAARDALAARQDVERIAIFDPDGKLVLETAGGGDETCLKHPIRYTLAERTHELGTLFLCVSPLILEAKLRLAAWDTVLSGFVVALCSIAAMLLSLRFLLQPLAPITSSLNALKAGKLDLQCSNEVRKDEFGQLQELILGFRDALLQQNEFNQRLKASEVRFRDFSASSADWFWEMDSDLRFCFFSENFEVVYGHPPDKLLGRTRREILGLHPGNETEETLAHLAQLDRLEPFRNFTYSLTDQSGHLRWYSISGIPYFNDDGEFMGYRGVGEDITQQKQKDDELLRYQHHLEQMVRERTIDLEEASLAAQAASHAKSTFLANMSHELRTPLHGIQGLGDLIERRVHAPEVLDFLRQLKSSARHMEDVVNDVLDVARIEAGMLTIENTPFASSELVERIESICRPNALRKGLEFFIDFQLPEVLFGDVVRLAQMLLNLSGNALKFTHQGSVTLRANVIRQADARQTIRFEVIDTGIGIAVDKQAQIFDAFEQADNSITRRYGGSGLGLAITRKLALLMQGEAGVLSELGRGSTFWFEVSLPLANAIDQGEVHAGVPVPSFDLSGSFVLAVDDEPINLLILEQFLAELGVTAEFAEDGEIAVAKAAEGKYDLIMMDIQMPRLDGLSATKAIRQLPTGREVPIIALSANVLTEHRKYAEEAGMNDFLEKPFDIDSLQSVLARWLKLHRV